MSRTKYHEEQRSYGGVNFGRIKVGHISQLKKLQVRSVLLFAVSVFLAYGIYRNLWEFQSNRVALPPLGQLDEIVTRENQFEPIRDALFRIENYRDGYLGYITNRSLRHEPGTDRDRVHWSELRYIAIPLMLEPDHPLDAPYVLGDFIDDSIPETPEGLIKIHDPGNGLILYRRNRVP
jgi:hypothetical protein